MIDKDKVKRRFSKNAKTYDKYANVQKLMGNKLIDIIDNRTYSSILEIGSGTGYVTELLRKKYPKAKITAMDIAEGMIEHTSKRMSDSNINFICGDFETTDIDGTFDLIISNATIQWFNNHKDSINKMKSLLNDGGNICISTFGSRTFTELHETYRALQDNCEDYIKPGQDFYDLIMLNDLMSVCFNPISVSTVNEIYIEKFKDCISFFNSIKKIGANNASSSNTVKDPKFILKVIDYYESTYKMDDFVYATYEGLFTLATKPIT